jgi:hypothetical protein
MIIMGIEPIFEPGLGHIRVYDAKIGRRIKQKISIMFAALKTGNEWH